MSAQIACPTCQTPLLAPPELAGQVVACPTCRQPIQLVAQQPVAMASQPGAVVAGHSRHPSAEGSGKNFPKARPLASQGGTIATQSFATSPHDPGPAPAGTTSRSAPPPKAARRKGLLLAALFSWGFILATILVPGYLLWRMRTRHLEQVAAQRSATPSSTKTVAAPVATNMRPASTPSPQAESSNSAASVTPLPTTTPIVSPSLPLSPATIPTSPQPSAVASAPTPAPLPVPSDLFGSLPAHFQLPALISIASEPLGALTREPTESIDVSVRYAAASIPAEAAIFTEPTNEPGEWMVAYVSSLQSAEGKVPLAMLRLAGKQWSWQWTEGEVNVPLRRQLANCQIELRHGNEQRIVQLRAPQSLAPLKIDLKQDSQKLDFLVPELPKVELLRVAIDGLDGFPAGATIDKQSLAAGDEAKITFADQPGAEIELRLRSLSTGPLVLQIEPRFREPNGRTYEMTLPRLSAMEEGVSKSLKEAERDLPVRQRELKAAVSAYQSLAGKQPGNPLLLPAWRGEVNSLESKAKRAASRVESLQKQIPMHKARLEAVPKTRSFLTSIDQRAAIRLRLVAECPDQEIVLVTASQ